MISNKKVIYFIGIGGIGMSALARYFNSIGLKVAGYDKVATSLTSSLIKEGIEVNFEDEPSAIPKFVLNASKSEAIIIFTPAIPAGNKQKNYLIEAGFELMKRSEVLGELSAEGTCIAVAGTHGKTTTSTLIAHILYSCNYPCNAFLGGISSNFNSNILLNPNANCNVVEADEYDRSFLKLFPTLAVVTSMDADHLDIYGNAEMFHKGFNDFVQQVKSNGTIIYKYGLPLTVNRKAFTYSITNDKADYYSNEISIEKGEYHFNITYPGGEITNITSGLPGRHNVENAVAAFAAAHQLGINVKEIGNAISTFEGVKRRFEYVIKTEKLIFIDDYAHHPAELLACISSVKEMFPNRKITGIFQPHLFSRTRDFAKEFAKSLESLDSIILLDIYPARELPIDGVNSQMLFDIIQHNQKKIIANDLLLKEIRNSRPEVLLTLGAGDIDKMVEPIKNELLKA